MAVDNLFTAKADLDLDTDTSIGGVVRQQSYITPKSGDILEQTGRTIGTLRREVRDARLRNAYLNAKWVVGRALIEGTEIYYNEDFSNRFFVTNSKGEQVTTRNREVARQIVAICEGPIEGIETIFVDGAEVELLQTIGQYGDFVNNDTNLTGLENFNIASFATNPITKEVYAAARYSESGNTKGVLGIINTRTLQFELIGELPFYQNYAAEKGLAFDRQGNLYAVGIDNGNWLWKVDPTLPSNVVGEFGKIGGEFPSQFIPSALVIDNQGRIYGREQITRDGHTSFWQFDITDPANTAAPYYVEINADARETERWLYWAMFYDFDTSQFISFIRYGHSQQSTREVVLKHNDLNFSSVNLDNLQDVFRAPQISDMTFDKDGHLISSFYNSPSRIYIRDIDDITSTEPIQFANPDLLPERSKLQFKGYLKRYRTTSNDRTTLSIRLFYDGINNRFDQSFLEYLSNNSVNVGAWTKDCIAKGIVCALIEYEQVEYATGSGDLTGGLAWEELPKIEFLVKGVKAKVPDNEEYIWTDNAASIRRWWLENRRSIPPYFIDEAAFKEAYNTCDFEVTNVLSEQEIEQGYPATSKRYTTNGVIFASDEIESVEDELDFSWAGNVVLGSDGRFLFRPGITRPIKAAITDNDIIVRGSIQLTNDRQSQVNSVSMSLAQNEHDNFLPIDIPPYDDNALIQRDGEVLPLDFGKRAFVTSPSTANRLLAQQLRLNRIVKRYSYKLSPRENFELMGLLPGDRVTIQDSVNGLLGLKCVIVSTKINNDFSLNVTVKESPDGIYADTGINPTLQRNLRIEQNRVFAWPYRDSESAYFVIDEARVTIGDSVFTTSSSFDRISADDLVTIEILNTGGFVSITPGTTAPPESLPDIVLPQISINAIPVGVEGSQVVLSATLINGNFDEVTYDWSVTGGELDNNQSPTPTLTRPNVSEDTTFTASLSLLVEGQGTRFKPRQEIVAAVDVDYVVQNSDIVAPTSAPNNLKETAISDQSITWSWDAVPSATYYEYRFIEGTTIPVGTDWQRIRERMRTFTGLKFNTEYVLEVRGGNSAGPGPKSVDSAVTRREPPEEPENKPPTDTIIVLQNRFVIGTRFGQSYFATVHVSLYRDFSRDDDINTYYSSVANTRLNVALPSLSSGTYYVRARLSTEINDGGVQGDWSNIVLIRP